MVLVIGGSGFLGRHLLRRLAGEHVVVKVYGRRPVIRPRGVQYIYGDLLDRHRLREALRGVDCVFHFAWTTVPQTSNEDPQADVQANVVTSLGLLDACKDEGVGMLVFPSSGGTVYGTGSEAETFDEATPTEPISSYGITKLMFEKYLTLYWQMYGIDYRILRISNAYGEGQQPDRPQGLVGVALQRILSDERLTVWGDGSTIRDYVYAGDVADCCFRAIRAPLSTNDPRLFNVGSQRGYSVNDVLATIGDVTGKKLAVDYAPARSCDAPRAVLLSNLAYEVLGWSPQVGLHEGISRTWKWVQSGARIAGDSSGGFFAID